MEVNLVSVTASDGSQLAELNGKSTTRHHKTHPLHLRSRVCDAEAVTIIMAPLTMTMTNHVTLIEFDSIPPYLRSTHFIPQLTEVAYG